MNKKTVNIDLLGKTYQINCPETEIESLQKAAQLLKEKMLSTRESAHLLSHDKVAVITSLNFAHQIIQLEQKNHEYLQTIGQRLHDLQDKIEFALSSNTMELVSAN